MFVNWKKYGDKCETGRRKDVCIRRRMDTLCGVLEFADPVQLCSSGEDILIVVFTDSFFFF